MKRVLLFAPLLFLLLLLISVGCGGGGGGGTSTTGTGSAIGRVLNVETGGPFNPGASVQIGGASTLTSLTDGSFTLSAPNGSSSLSVVPPVFGARTFPIAPLTGPTVVGDLWVGPEQVTLSGTVLDSTSNSPVPNADVSFGGRFGKTNSQGVFSLTGVAYSSRTQTAFWGIAGVVLAPNYFKAEFSASPNVAVSGIVDVGTILVTPSNDPNPPGPPYNIVGKVGPSATASGTIVTLRSGSTAVRVFNVGSDGRYTFWVGTGSYSITFQNGGRTAPTQSVTLTQPNQVITVPDVTLSP